MKILLFKTNIETTSDKKVVAEVFKQYKGISNWNVDFESKEKTLRIQGYGLTAKEIIRSTREAGYQCSEINVD